MPKRRKPAKLLGSVEGIDIFQEQDSPGLRVVYIADLDVDVDGAAKSYRMDNNPELALDDIHASAGYPNGGWRQVLAVDPQHHNKPFVDANGYCVSKTTYWWEDFEDIDRQKWVDAVSVPYAVAPALVRERCKGVLVGCAARITRITDGASIDCVCGDLSGDNIGEASDKAAKFFDPSLSARNGDERHIYRYEFFPNTPATIGGVTYRLIPFAS